MGTVCTALLGHCDAKLLMTRLFGFVTASEMLSWTKAGCQNHKCVICSYSQGVH